eukprot:TRINITY_DN31968_c0_g1_i1.p1 TRINITY_DN31968_c0_g1~~TRINITY_DN31968_c0_g1_i1.p1  ORF type:complete len:408 (+),score=136.07 TRINITY_DN31968_c0_g1_i1:210-1433(+)
MQHGQFALPSVPSSGAESTGSQGSVRSAGGKADPADSNTNMEAAPSSEESQKKWNKVDSSGTLPIGRIGHSICHDGKGNLYLWGGVNDGVEGKYLADFFRYDFHSKDWSAIPLQGEDSKIPVARAFHSAVCYKNNVVIFGGCNGKGRFHQINMIDCDSGHCDEVETKGEKPQSRYCHTAVEYQGKMLVFGGKNGGRNSNKRLSDIFSYEFETQTWTSVNTRGEAPSSRSAHTSVVYGKKMLVFGGRDTDGGCCKDFYEFHLESNMWRKLQFNDNQLLVRARHSAVVHGDNIIIFGGWNGKKKLNDLCMYNPSKNTIQVIHDSDDAPVLPCRRECHTTVIVNDTLVLFGGRFRGVIMNDSYEYPLAPLSLKHLLRNWFVTNNVPIPTDVLPSSLAAHFTNYKKRFIDG